VADGASPIEHIEQTATAREQTAQAEPAADPAEQFIDPVELQAADLHPADRIDQEVAAEFEQATEVVPEPEPEPAARVEPEICSYRTYNWSTEERRAVNRRTIEHSYADVTDDERSPADPRCTVCSEDQVAIDPSEFGFDHEEVWVCWAYADEIRTALSNIAGSEEFRLVELTGYRPGRTRGRVVDGLRSEWSNHSFGTALDVNADYNGLYRSCDVDEVTASNIDDCRLGVGGEWDPNDNPRRTVTRDSIVYSEFIERVGWMWGGEIDGSTKDMMHFSPDGY
jgi:hypothetical protein